MCGSGEPRRGLSGPVGFLAPGWALVYAWHNLLSCGELFVTKQWYAAMRAAVLVGCFGGLAVPGAAQAQSYLTGLPALACEAILCLSSSVQPGACGPSLSHYFGIKGKNMFSDRLNFLNMCPTVSAGDPNMPSLTSAIATAAGQCDVKTLNQRIAYWNGFEDVPMINPTPPAVCANYFNHPYVRKNAPKYVGDPVNGGHWE